MRRYVCASGPGLAGCGGVAVLAEPVETLITEAVWLRLDSPAMAMALAGRVKQDANAASLQDELDRDQAQLNALASLHGQRVISLPEFIAALEPIL